MQFGVARALVHIYVVGANVLPLFFDVKKNVAMIFDGRSIFDVHLNSNETTNAICHKHLIRTSTFIISKKL